MNDESSQAIIKLYGIRYLSEVVDRCELNQCGHAVAKCYKDKLVQCGGVVDLWQIGSCVECQCRKSQHRSNSFFKNKIKLRNQQKNHLRVRCCIVPYYY